MKRLVLLLLAITSACSAQVETGGLTIPGDGAVQIVRKAASVDYDYPTEELQWLLFPFNYAHVDGGTDTITDASPNGYVLSQSTETKKPLNTSSGLYFDSGDYLSVTNRWAESGVGTITVYVGFLATSGPTNFTLFDTSAEAADKTRLVHYWQLSGSDLRMAAEHGESGGSGQVIGNLVAVPSWPQLGASEYEAVVYASANSATTTYDIRALGNAQYAASATGLSNKGFSNFFFGANYAGNLGFKGYIRYLAIYTEPHDYATRQRLTQVFERIYALGAMPTP